ncbi:hypothetical protein ACSLBF_06975 [Pseudoalteromonas sp. T1lg65]|uniref:hypothetical protein n=1 Tax=Pseudoalteromonas sp. T1lg65 TaxID=2077101 RepID=UPI003F7A6E39
MYSWLDIELENLPETLKTNPIIAFERIKLAQQRLDHTRAISLINSMDLAMSDSHSVKFFAALSYLALGERTQADKLFSEAATAEGQFQLSAQVYTALLNNQNSTLVELKQVIKRQKEDNIWPELAFLQGLIELHLANHTRAFKTLAEAIKLGFSDSFRFSNLPISVNSDVQQRIEQLQTNLNQQNQSKRLKRTPKFNH